MNTLLKILTISYLSILTVAGIIIFIIIIRIISSTGNNADASPTVAMGLGCLVTFQLAGLILCGITTIVSFARYSDYAKYSLIPLVIWILSLILLVAF